MVGARPRERGDLAGRVPGRDDSGSTPRGGRSSALLLDTVATAAGARVRGKIPARRRAGYCSPVCAAGVRSDLQAWLGQPLERRRDAGPGRSYERYRELAWGCSRREELAGWRLGTTALGSSSRWPCTGEGLLTVAARWSSSPSRVRGLCTGRGGGPGVTWTASHTGCHVLLASDVRSSRRDRRRRGAPRGPRVQESLNRMTGRPAARSAPWTYRPDAPGSPTGVRIQARTAAADWPAASRGLAAGLG